MIVLAHTLLYNLFLMATSRYVLLKTYLMLPLGNMNEETTNLYAKVLDEYSRNIDTLKFSDKYHFLHHLYLWNKDNWLSEELISIKKEVVADEATMLKRMNSQLINTATQTVKNAAQLRKKYILKHPDVRPLSNLLLETLYMRTVFSVDNRSFIPGLTQSLDIPNILEGLLADPEAMAFLSTYAINFIYIYDRFYAETDNIIPEDILGCADILDKNEPQELLLYFYFVTHCIIGESLFYAKPIPQKYLPTYQLALQKLDDILMSDSYSLLHMDVKFETIVCAKMCGIKLKSETKIYNEALRSLSGDGNFIVDTHNMSAQGDFLDLSSSEHRNVLFLMSCKDYKPIYSADDF